MDAASKLLSMRERKSARIMRHTRLDSLERHAVETVRRAQRIQIIIDTENQPSYLELCFDARTQDISELRRNLRLTVQDYFQKSHRGG